MTSFKAAFFVSQHKAGFLEELFKFFKIGWGTFAQDVWLLG